MVRADAPLGQQEAIEEPPLQPRSQLRGRGRGSSSGLQVFSAAAAKENRMPSWDSFSSGGSLLPAACRLPPQDVPAAGRTDCASAEPCVSLCTCVD